MVKTLLFFCFLTTAFSSFAQDTLNRTDEKGLRQGYWILYGRDFPDMGYADNVKVMEGQYVNNHKEGSWTKYHENGISRKLVGYYKDNKAYGDYSKFNVDGTCIERGCFQSGHYVDTLFTYNESGALTLCVVFDSKGREREMRYPQIIDLSTPQTKQAYGQEVASRRTRYPKAVVPPETVPRGSIRPASPEKKKKIRNGYHSVTIRRDQRIEQLGEFKNGVLYSGVERHYNESGELIQTLFFEEGRYIEKNL